MHGTMIDNTVLLLTLLFLLFFSTIVQQYQRWV